MPTDTTFVYAILGPITKLSDAFEPDTYALLWEVGSPDSFTIREMTRHDFEYEIASRVSAHIVVYTP